MMKLSKGLLLKSFALFRKHFQSQIFRKNDSKDANRVRRKNIFYVLNGDF